MSANIDGGDAMRCDNNSQSYFVLCCIELFNMQMLAATFSRSSVCRVIYVIPVGKVEHFFHKEKNANKRTFRDSIRKLICT